MGTHFNVTVVGLYTDAALDKLEKDIIDRLAFLNSTYSTYIPDSELMRFNRSPVNEWQPVSEELYGVLTLSQSVYEVTHGAFDTTIGPLVNLWGFGPQKRNAFPEESAILSALAEMGFEHVELRENPRAARRTKDVFVDLSAIAKGFSVDEISDLLTRDGYQNHLVEIGGEIRTKGRNKRHQPWRLGIESPNVFQGGVQRAVNVENAAIATSGDYRNFFMKDGVRYSHTLDPRTGRPITHNLASVTVIESRAGFVDAIATAFSVMGEQEAMQVCEQHQLACFFLTREGEGQFAESQSSAFSAYID
ncbi:FAD:protein FMN transferase [Marinibactrum halimedae]|uniref:FAD:protein FMN transferase n=1 Tax=Marinibactrum halimedae TaxID=1444977 RepID=A0AA37T620_9GAMM|nr:FAD:protein FMN transferase [Marinibactrum halimedae]MCD9459479.1 FAD:protein FMN transferase [Marinibactrum halimedae]GLS28133.1 thiamin biosynthesis lipoprotein ApbE [Marinibactrum halimedae]